MAKVFVVDDHPIVPMAIRLALRGAEDLQFQGSSHSADAALPLIAGARPDALILDLVLGRHPDIDLIRQCRALLPRAAIVVFTSLVEDDWPARALAAGADDVVSKDQEATVLIDRVRDLLARHGRPHHRDKPADGQSERARLTRRESEVASLLSTGASIHLIARDLNISSKTAAAHRDNLRTKMRCGSTRELVVLLAKTLGS